MSPSQPSRFAPLLKSIAGAEATARRAQLLTAPPLPSVSPASSDTMPRDERESLLSLVEAYAGAMEPPA